MKTLVLSVLALLMLGCKKDDPEANLPAATQVGANTGGCLIEGELFVATGWGTNNILSNAVPALSGGFSFDSVYYLQLNGQLRGHNTTLSIYFTSRQLKTYPLTGTYTLNRTTQYYPAAIRVADHATYTYEVSGAQNEVYVTSAQHTGQVQLTYADVKTGISAGTFAFTAASQVDPTKTVTITSGRFDRKQ